MFRIWISLLFPLRGDLIGSFDTRETPRGNIKTQNFTLPLNDEFPWPLSFYQFQLVKNACIGHFFAIIAEDQVSNLETNALAFAVKLNLINRHGVNTGVPLVSKYPSLVWRPRSS